MPLMVAIFRAEVVEFPIYTYRKCIYIYIYIVFCQNGSEMARNRSGMLPGHSRTLLGHFWNTTFCTKKQLEMLKLRQQLKKQNSATLDISRDQCKTRNIEQTK